MKNLPTNSIDKEIDTDLQKKGITMPAHYKTTSFAGFKFKRDIPVMRNAGGEVLVKAHTKEVQVDDFIVTSDGFCHCMVVSMDSHVLYTVLKQINGVQVIASNSLRSEVITDGEFAAGYLSETFDWFKAIANQYPQFNTW